MCYVSKSDEIVYKVYRLIDLYKSGLDGRDISKEIGMPYIRVMTYINILKQAEHEGKDLEFEFVVL